MNSLYSLYRTCTIMFVDLWSTTPLLKLFRCFCGNYSYVKFRKKQNTKSMIFSNIVYSLFSFSLVYSSKLDSYSLHCLTLSSASSFFATDTCHRAWRRGSLRSVSSVRVAMPCPRRSSTRLQMDQRWTRLRIKHNKQSDADGQWVGSDNIHPTANQWSRLVSMQCNESMG